MLQRIYGTAFATQQELDDYLKMLEEAEKRDHRKLGKDLDLFSLRRRSRPGAGALASQRRSGAHAHRGLLAAKSTYARRLRACLHAAHRPAGPLGAPAATSTSSPRNMYQPMDVEGAPYRIKPMNCPFHLLIYKSRMRSYREMPIRWAELGTVYRYERSGMLHGLIRVRGFTQDDAHILCYARAARQRDQSRSRFRAKHTQPVRLRRNTASIFRPGPSTTSVSREGWDKATAALRKRAGGQGARLQSRRGRRSVLRPQDRREDQRRAGRVRPVQHDPGRFQRAGALRSDLRRPGQCPAQADHDPPRAAGLAGTVLWRS